MRNGMGMGAGGGKVTLNKSLYTWVAPDGNDTTGDGTFANPYATIAKAESLTLTGTKATIYCKAGTYTEAHEFSKAYTWRAYGAVTLKSSGTSQVVKSKASVASAFKMYGFTLDGQTTAGIMVNISAGTGTIGFYDCAFINPKSSGFGIQILNYATPAITLDNCTMTGVCRTWVCDRSAPANSYDSVITVNGCTITGGACDYGAILIGEYANGTNVNSCTATITNNKFIGNTYNDIRIGKSGTFTITGNTFQLTADKVNTYSIIMLIRGTNMTGVTGTIAFDNNTITLGTYKYTAASVLDYSRLCVGTYAVSVKGNTITGSSSAITGNVIVCDNGLAFDCQNNIINLPSAASLSTSIQYKQPTVTPTGTLKIAYNTIYAKQATGYVIQAGTDTPDTNNDLGDGLIIEGNLIYGARYYGEATPTVHTIFVGYFKNVIVRHNTLIGGGHGLIWEHNNVTDAAAGAGFYNNVAIDCFTGLVISGINNAKAYGNTIINRIASTSILVTFKWNDTMTGVEWDEENPTPNTGFEFKNNIVFSTGTTTNNALISLGDHCAFAEAGCDYNALYTNYPTRIGVVISTAKTIAEWIALGYDANSLWDEGACVEPDLTLLTGAMASVNPRPIASANVIGISANLGTSYDDAMDIVSVPPSITTKNQPSAPDLWTIGAYIR